MSESDLMELVQLNIRVPRYLKLSIEAAAKLSGLTQEAYLDEAISDRLSKDSALLKEAFRLSSNFLSDLSRQRKFKPDAGESQP